MTTLARGRTGAAGVSRPYGDMDAAVPRQLLPELASELAPALVEDGTAEAGLGPGTAAGFFLGALGRARQALDFQAPDADRHVDFLMAVEVLCRCRAGC